MVNSPPSPEVMSIFSAFLKALLFFVRDVNPSPRIQTSSTDTMLHFRAAVIHAYSHTWARGGKGGVTPLLKTKVRVLLPARLLFSTPPVLEKFL